MPNLNKVLLMGNLTRNPEIRKTPSGQSVCEFGIAVNRSARNKNGEERQETCFIDVIVWGKPAEACGSYLLKGSGVFVDGHLILDQWEKDGEKRSRIRVVAEKISFLSGTKNSNSGNTAATNYPNGIPPEYGPEMPR